MRSTLSALALVLLAAAPGDAHAQQGDPYPWCAEYSGGGLGGSKNCYLMTLEQCRATVSGVGGNCTPNPFYTGPANPRPPQPRRSPPPRPY